MAFGTSLPKSVKRITFVRARTVPSPSGDEASSATPADVLIRQKKKKKISRGLRSFEKWTRRLGRAVTAVGGNYVIRHDRSNRKKRDGWLRDYVFNMAKANREGLKKLHVPVFKL